MSSIHSLLGAIGLISLAVAAGYALLALAAVLIWRSRQGVKPTVRLPPVTVLKSDDFPELGRPSSAMTARRATPSVPTSRGGAGRPRTSAGNMLTRPIRSSRRLPSGHAARRP